MKFFRILSLFVKYFLVFLIFPPLITFADYKVIVPNNNSYSIGLDLGIAKPTNLGPKTTFPLGYSTFTYSPDINNVQTLISGISLNKTLPIMSLYTLQAGISYHYLASMNVNGNLEQGISPPYYQSTYAYTIKSSLYLLEGKIHRPFYTYFFPYFYLALGEASNKAYNYSTNVPDYLTVTPTYSSKTTNSFAYSVGIGLDYFVLAKVSIGLGYRFINLGKAGLGTGTIRNTSVGAELTQSNLYLNTILAQINYFI